MGESLENSRTRKSILVVEDHEYSARIYCDFLKVWGYDFERVSNGIEAVEAARSRKFDVIMMDVMMPRMNGYEATKRILAGSDRHAPPQVVGVTANTLESDMKRCREAGMSKVLIKPLDFDRLLVLLDSILLLEVSPDESEPYMVSSFKQRNMRSSNIVDEKVANEFVERMNSIPKSRNPLDAFSQSVEECMEKLEKAVSLGDRTEIEGCAHILKSVASLVGARDLEDLSRGLEGAARRGGTGFKPYHWFALISDAVTALRLALLPQ